MSEDLSKLRYCQVCRRTMISNQFYTSNNTEKYPDGKMNVCKKCMTLCVDLWDPQTFKPILKEIDIPYIKDEWDVLLKRYTADKKPEDISATGIIGRYIAKMKLRQWKDYRWADSERIQQEKEERKISVMRATGVADDEIESTIKADAEYVVPRPQEMDGPVPLGVETANGKQTYAEGQNNINEFENSLGLTEEDIIKLRLKWGKNYSPEEWVAMEQLYTDMSKSYDIQTAGHKDTLKLVCKTSLKANQLIDSGNIDDYQKVSRVYDTLMKSGCFTAAQNKSESGDFIDSISELVAMCEKEGFIPRYYIEKPADRVDRTLEDLQRYTRTLVEEEMGLGDQIESAAKLLLEARKNEYNTEADGAEDDEVFEEKLFSEKAEDVIGDEDFRLLREKEQAEANADAAYIQRVLSGEED